MNSLSWTLYLIEVITNVNFVAAAWLIGGGVAIALMWFFGGMMLDLQCSVDTADTGYSIMRRVSKIWAAGAVFAAIICIFVPSKQTFYLIAASEIGERVAQSDAVSGIAMGANDIVREYLKRAKDNLLKGNTQ